jgi:monothiol glutaredoxin
MNVMSENPVFDRIKEYVNKDDVVLFMKGTPIFPQCGFSSVVSQVLQHIGVEYESYNVLEDMEVREGIKAYSDWPTIPQLDHNKGLPPWICVTLAAPTFVSVKSALAP